MKKIILTAILSVFCVGFVNAQERTKQYYTFGWNVSQLIGNSNDFISNTSPSGYNFGGQIYLTDNFALGFNFLWSNYYQLIDRESYKVQEGVYVTASQYRYAKVIPMQAGAFYNFLPDNPIIQPYAGLKMGLTYSQQHVFVSDYDFWDDDYGFNINPEIGTYINFGENSRWGANLALGYSYSTNSYSFLKEYKGIQAINGTVGIFCRIN